MAHVAGVFQDNLTKSISESKVLMVGAGGIGCELLKNIVLTGKNTETEPLGFIPLKKKSGIEPEMRIHKCIKCRKSKRLIFN